MWIITAALIAFCRFFWHDSAVTGCPYLQFSAVTGCPYVQVSAVTGGARIPVRTNQRGDWMSVRSSQCGYRMSVRASHGKDDCIVEELPMLVQRIRAVYLVVRNAVVNDLEKF